MHIVTRAVGALVAAAAVTATSLPAHAVEDRVTVDDRLEQIALVDDAVPVGQSPLARVGSDGTVRLDTAVSSPITLDLPVATGSTVSKVDGRYVLPASEDASVAVAPTPTGTQILVGIESAGAPTSYDFGLGAPVGFSPELRPDGAVDIVNERGDVAAQVETPWAIDAQGRRVPTRFELRGDAIRQVVDHRAGNYSYPIVADPKIFACDLYTSLCVKFTKSETKSIATKAKKAGTTSKALAVFICAKIPHPVISVACAATVLAVLPALRKSFISAASNGKCVELHFRVPSGLLWKWKTEKC